jgi:hypothetical protein
MDLEGPPALVEKPCPRLYKAIYTFQLKVVRSYKEEYEDENNESMTMVTLIVTERHSVQTYTKFKHTN